MYDVLEGCRLKVKAMTDHMTRLQESIDRFFEDKLEIAPIVGEPNANCTQYLFRVESVIEYPSIEWGVIIGEAVHSVRSALDQLVWGFAKDRNDQERRGFPIFATEKDWVIKGPAMYWSTPEGFVRLLNSVQPYHRGDTNEARKHPLWILNALSNLDKHRAIPSIALVSDSGEATVVACQGIAGVPSIHLKNGVPYKPDQVVAKARIKPDGSGLQPHIDAEFKMTFDVGFGEIGSAPSISHKPVEDVMMEVFSYAIDRILDPIAGLWNEAVVAAEGTGEDAEGDVLHDDSP